METLCRWCKQPVYGREKVAYGGHEDCFANASDSKPYRDEYKDLLTDNAPELIAGASEKEILALSISNLGLPVRVLNRLYSFGGLCCIGDLIQKTEQELSRVKNIGEETLQVIKNKLQARGLELRKPLQS